MIDAIFRREWGRVLAALIGFLGDFDLAEEAAQEAFVIAAERWPRDGMPDQPVAWLVRTGRNRAIDRIRREQTLRSKTQLLRADQQATTMNDIDLDDSTIGDERLELIFMCCHPALAPEAQVALTLRALGGLTTAEIGRAFLVSEDTMKRRLSRAKAKIKATNIPFALPADRLLPDRVATVLAVIYLIFNQGFTERDDLAAEAIRLARLLSELLVDEPEAYGLLALMLLHDSRRAARVVAGQVVPLGEQDRTLHDQEKVEAGRAALDRALALRLAAGPYVLQAAIASLQAERDIDWHEVVALYGRLEALTGSPVVALNRAVAIAEAGDPARALALVDSLDLGDYRYVPSSRAELLRRLGRTDEARHEFERALALATTDPERRFLEHRLTELGRRVGEE
ncbi:sigma-70 family RNA polymerase sigma factor [Mycobacterium sp. CBMA293]|nr:sigma-70 family RNA polymerase sigma factor [Mycolicibacterium sp. CBMA 360]MUL62619.1 sigma-70 family RNA polymerase sigma factor [Mycolicibacterium sp. CBMA 335]MUL72562.1 sigma-70 family RNA polymerase sigma factor [Mycolicibacterium sp. CBMA 311]MUL95037.1 sigma-70 family RNA polymerase sigma factor [Mycolicibacterium sp. CBMA 230]MUM04105.1 RNA polymerase subunit sigma-24 [Mycolicibacterium sp. CBMA 213]MUM15148.1 sigma-70 family RNA polymerase sigma factor [Mycolicibacterium sp. CBMA 